MTIGGGIVDRRTALRWVLAAVSAGAASACGRSSEGSAPLAPRAPRADLGAAAPLSGAGYGSDPALIDPVVTWSRTMTEAQLRLARSLADRIIPADGVSPAAGDLGAHEFIDEWVSAPYPQQQADRELFFLGFTALEQEALDRFGEPFASLTAVQGATILDDIAYEGRIKPGLEQLGEFFARFRWLAMSAFYATNEGMADLGYLGNTPMPGAYPGPSPEAIAHLDEALAQLGLTRSGGG